MNKNILENNIKRLPMQPGCYLFKNKTGQILYVGKAKNLRNRVRSYFAKSADLSPAKLQMLKEIDKIDYITVRNEAEALLLESNLIKKHQPSFNVILKDDKFFQYIKIVKETMPRIVTCRKIETDGSEYYGPYSSAASVKQTLKLLKKIFPFRATKQNDFIYDVLKAGEEISEVEYKKIIDQIRQVLKGKVNKVQTIIETQMAQASQKQNYEQAAYFRDQIKNLHKIASFQQAIINDPINVDIINWTNFKGKIYLAVIKIRQGKIIDKLNAYLNNPLKKETEVIHSFIKQYYLSLSDQPQTLVLPIDFKLNKSEQKLIFSKNIEFKKPYRGKFKKLLNLALLNAVEYAKQNQPTFTAANDIKTALDNIKKSLGLKQKPKRIECYDISNIQGKFAVGAMVVFTSGKPDKSQYRKFSIKYTKHQPNDYAMLSEIITRRLRHTNWPNPNLIIIDGGKGQLSIVKKTMDSLGINLPLVALAKQKEELFVLNRKTSIRLNKNSPEYFLVQRIRDEAHRFAISFYRHKHRQSFQA